MKCFFYREVFFQSEISLQISLTLFELTFREYGRRYPDRGYGGMFREWLFDDSMGPYNSFGNGSAMRVSAVGFACDTLEQVMAEAERSADVTHNHPDGVKGAKAVATALFLAKHGELCVRGW